MPMQSAIAQPSVANPAGTTGVDMSSNPLTLGSRKLRSAVNLQFVEGVIRTRPGFRYQKLGVSGQFQGGLHYSPSKGLSSRPFALKNSSLMVAVRGKVFAFESSQGLLSCGPQPLCGDYDFACKGPVNLYQAENWLVVQNKQSNTWFWEGSNCLVESPGMAEDREDTDPQLPTPPGFALGRCWSVNTVLQITVLDNVTGEPIVGATIVLKVGSRVDYTAVSNPYGETRFEPVPKSYTYTVTKFGYTAVSGTVVILKNGTQMLTVRMGSTGVANLTFSVIEDYGGAPIVGALVEVSLAGVVQFTGLTNGSGALAFNNIPANFYSYTVSKAGFNIEPPAVVSVPNGTTVNRLIRLVGPVPRNLHGFLSTPGSGSVPGRYSLAAFFNTDLFPPVPDGNSARTQWRLITDGCGYDILYATGPLSDTGKLASLGETDSTLGGYYDFALKELISNYLYPEGVYLQLGVDFGSGIVWPPRTPCIAGGNTSGNS